MRHLARAMASDTASISRDRKFAQANPLGLVLTSCKSWRVAPRWRRHGAAEASCTGCELLFTPLILWRVQPIRAGRSCMVQPRERGANSTRFGRLKQHFIIKFIISPCVFERSVHVHITILDRPSVRRKLAHYARLRACTLPLHGSSSRWWRGSRRACLSSPSWKTSSVSPCDRGQ